MIAMSTMLSMWLLWCWHVWELFLVYLTTSSLIFPSAVAQTDLTGAINDGQGNEGCKWAWEHTWRGKLGKWLGKSHLVVGREKAEDSEEPGNWGATNFSWITKDGCSHWAQKRTWLGHYCHMCAFFSYWRMRLNNTCWNEILCISHILALETSCI